MGFGMAYLFENYVVFQYNERYGIAKVNKRKDYGGHFSGKSKKLTGHALFSSF